MSYVEIRKLADIAIGEDFENALGGAQVGFATAEVVRGCDMERPTTTQGREMLEFMRAAEQFADCARKVRPYLPE